MRRQLWFLLPLVVAAIVIASPGVALAPVATKTPVSAGYSATEYWAYQNAAGQWWIDGAVSNMTGGPVAPYNTYPVTSLESVVVTIEYLDASNAVVGTSEVPVLAYVLGSYDIPNSDYYSYVHVKQSPPTGADPARTRVADPTLDPTKHYGYATSKDPVRISAVPSVPTVGAGGRTTYDITVTNTSPYNVVGVKVVGSETFYLTSPSGSRFLDALSAAGPSWMAPGSSTSVPVQLSGLAATPTGYNRGGLQVWAEAIEAPDANVWRFYNKKTGTHFYTASDYERDNVIAKLGYLYTLEGKAYDVVEKKPNNDTVLWRFYNKKTGTHFYTASETEKAKVIATLGHIFAFEGVAYRVSDTNEPTAKKVYRFFNKKNGSHFYTSSETEKNDVVAKLGHIYTLEGIAYYLAQ